MDRRDLACKNKWVPGDKSLSPRYNPDSMSRMLAIRLYTNTTMCMF